MFSDKDFLTREILKILLDRTGQVEVILFFLTTLLRLDIPLLASLPAIRKLIRFGQLAANLAIGDR